MTTYQYCTPEWLEEALKLYPSNEKAQGKLKKLSVKMAFRVKADQDFGIDEDILFCGFLTKGNIDRLELISAENANADADFIMVAEPKIWKKILKKENKFVTDFMLGKIKLEKGSQVAVLSVAPHADTLIEVLTPFELLFGDDLSPEELEQYKSNMAVFREKLGV